jgi:Tfp pilus assembly protein PilF
MDISEYIFSNAVLKMRKGDHDGALADFAETIRANPKHVDAWSLRGRLENEAGRPFNGFLHMEAAAQMAPGRHDIWHDRGIIAAAAGYHDIAKVSFARSLAIQETYETHYQMGNVLCTTMEIDAAVEHYKKALKIDASLAQLHTNLGIALMAQGHWREGFNAHRHRFGAPGFPLRPQHDYPLWRGEDLFGKTILLYVEQGFGDEILGMRFAKTVAALGARVILSVRPLMYRLAREQEIGNAVIMQHDTPLWKPDYAAALLDVPAFTDMSPETVPLKAGYLRPPKRDVGLLWGPGFRVGICWSSGKRPLQPSTDAMAAEKSLSFADLAPLAREGVCLVSLQHQHNDDAALRKFRVTNPMPAVQDFADTAWLIDQLDLVISVDTAVAHLAGAMGKPVWNLVRHDGLWPWGKATRETCWYDSMRLYRQSRPLDWKEPPGRLMKDFAALVAEREAAA